MQKRVRPEHHKHQSHQHLRNNRCDLHLSSTQPDLAPGKLSKLVQLLLKVTLSMARSIAPLPCSPPSHNRSKIPVATIASPTAVAAPEAPQRLAQAARPGSNDENNAQPRRGGTLAVCIQPDFENY